MATPNKGLEQPVVGSPNWGVPVNSNADYLDAALGETFTLNVTGVPVTPVALTLSQYRCLSLTFTGTLSNNVEYQVPADVAGQWIVINSTTGAFALTISHASGGPDVIVGAGANRTIYADGTSRGIVVADTQYVALGADTEVLYFGPASEAISSPEFSYDGSTLRVTREETGATTVQAALKVGRTSVDAPAVGSGAGIEFEVETAPSVSTLGMVLAAVATDVTPATEDYKMQVKLMKAGAAATSVLEITSDGLMTVQRDGGANNVLTAGRPTEAQSVGLAGITAVAANDGTKTTGTYTPSPIGGNFKQIVSNGAFTLAAPVLAGDYTLIIQITNGATPGVVTLTGFTKVTGSLTTGVGSDFFIFITKCNGFILANISALQ